MRKESDIKNRLGEIRTMNCGEECEIVEYRSALDITVQFIKTGELVESRYSDFKIGNIKSRLTPSVYGVGIVGLETTIGGDGKMIESYQTWKNMIRRCCDKKFQDKNPTYKDCSVCEEWLYYHNFKKWYNKNYYEVGNEKMCLDKDILIKGNKIYSPETCIFVPKNINVLFTKSDAKRGNLPIGVCWHKRGKKYQTRCKIFDITINKSKLKFLACYNTPQEAFNAYKKAKEENIRQMADYYKEQIPKKLYNAMYKYEVHIDD